MMFPILDHVDTLIAADFYEENNQNLLSEAMKLLNRPNLEFRFNGISSTRCKSDITNMSFSGFRSESMARTKFWQYNKSISGTKTRRMAVSISKTK